MRKFHFTSVPEQAMEGIPGVSLRWVLAKNVDAPNFAMRVIDVQPGAATEHHQHGWEHEVFILEGEGVVHNIAGRTAIGPGDCVYIAPNEIHQFANTGQSVLRFICVIPNPR